MDRQKGEEKHQDKFNDDARYFGESIYFSDNEIIREMSLKGRRWSVGLYLKNEKRD